MGRERQIKGGKKKEKEEGARSEVASSLGRFVLVVSEVVVRGATWRSCEREKKGRERNEREGLFTAVLITRISREKCLFRLNIKTE